VVFEGPLRLPELSNLIIEGRNFYLTDFLCSWPLLLQSARVGVCVCVCVCVCVDNSATTVHTISLLVGSNKNIGQIQ